MKKMWLFVFLGLTVAGLPLFGGGAADMFGGKKGGQQGAGAGGPAEAAAVAEMPPLDSYSPPSPRQGLQRAGSNVYVWTADPLKPVDEKLPPPVYAISGVKGREIGKYIVGGEYKEKDFLDEVVDVVVILPEKESFSQGILEGTDVSDWIQNLPKGLEARAHGIKKGATSIKIYISGTPEVTMREVIRVTIPGTWLTGGSARSFDSPTEEDSYNSWVASQTQE
jgi:hypothetical protein